MEERPIRKILQELRSDPDIKYISDKSAHSIHDVSCPVLDMLPDGIALGGYSTFPKKRYCVCEKCLPQAAQEYKSRMRDSVRRQMFHTAWNDPHIRYACDAAKRICHRKYSPCRRGIPTEKLFFLPKFPDVGLTLCPECLQMRNGTIYARFADFQSLARSQKRWQNARVDNHAALRRTMHDFCNSHHIFLHIEDLRAYVTTITGQWYFDILPDSGGRISLFHRNYYTEDMPDDLVMASFAQSAYHLQDIDLRDAMAAMQYIMRHDRAQMHRMLWGDAVAGKGRELQ